MTEIHIERRSEPDRLRYLAAKLREGGHEAAVAFALEAAAEEIGDVAGYTVLSDHARPFRAGPPERMILYHPESLYHDAVRAQREARRAQAHADLDTDLTDGRLTFFAAELRRLPAPVAEPEGKRP